jgi:hypothetical protein
VLGGKQAADILFTKHQRLAGNYESWPVWFGRVTLIEIMWGKGSASHRTALH